SLSDLQTISPTESSPNESSNVPRRASAIPISCVKARSRNYAGICTETNKQKTPRLPRPTERLVRQGALRRRKTTTKRSQRREHYQLPHPSLVETVTRRSAVQKLGRVLIKSRLAQFPTIRRKSAQTELSSCLSSREEGHFGEKG